MKKPLDIQLIGKELAVKWDDESESYYPVDFLRAASPSAENTGERDLFGIRHGGTDQKQFPGVQLRKWEFIGGYAIRLVFSDGHATGIYSYEYLQKLDELLEK